MMINETNMTRQLADLPMLQADARTVLIREGETARRLYFISKGAVRLWLNKNGRDITTQFFFEGEGATSLESFLYGEPSPFTIEAIEPCTLSVLHKEAYDRLMVTDPGFKEWFYQTAVQKQIGHTRRLLSFITRTPAQRYQDLCTSNPELLQRVSQQYIASYLGITAVSLSRIRGRRS